MNNKVRAVKCSIVRGGTSKAVFIMDSELPKNAEEREKVILAVFGSPSLRQLDGLGGADITTSKVAIIGPSTREDADINYTFGQVSMDEPFVDFGGNCGNISSGVGPFAIHNGLVKIEEPITTVRIHMTNTNNILIAKVRVEDGKPCIDGECEIGGVPGTSSPIEMDWSDVVGSSTGKLLPTGNPKDEIEMDEKTYTVSVVDSGNIVIFIRANEFGLSGIETPDEINGDKEISYKIEKLRGIICAKIGLVDKWENAKLKIPYQPFFALLTEPTDYITYTHEQVKKTDCDIVARVSLMLSVVKAYPGTATACTGCAARIKGSLVYEMLSEEAKKKEFLNIGHPTGTISVNSVCEYEGDSILPKMKKLSFIRTARVLMEGTAFIRKSVL